MTFQNMIRTLNDFWGEKGCIVGQPYGVEVGAGTANPNTFFRVLGPEPYNVAYIEPSRRPTDGRYGESPNRLQHYFQYQVILKPAPEFNQELFIESLIALGIDPTKHDIRFVEDNWESAPLGAWGLGWEVWCDGMEVAQYTYFQQMAGSPMEIPVLEITYGLERLMMYMQDVDDYKEGLWNEKTTYGQIYKRHEYWQSKYNFDTATTLNIQTLFSTYEDEVQKQIQQGSFWGAYDSLLKMSHNFNLLDARGVVSSADRVVKFGAMGKYSRQIGELYLEDRKALGYPLKKHMAPITYKPKVEQLESTEKTKYQKNVSIVELGIEELPADYLMAWKKEITHAWFKQELRRHNIAYRKDYIYTTPRRIVLKIVQPSKKGTVEELVWGPPINIAYDNSNKPTKALESFIAKNNILAKDIKVKQKDGKDFISANKVTTYKLEEVLQNIVNEVFEKAPKTKWMMWNENIPTFIRPLRSIVAFHNNRRLDISAMEISAGKFTFAPRYEMPAQIEVRSAQQYLSFIQEYGIILSIPKRKKRILRSIRKHNSDPIGKFDSMVEKSAYMTENPHVATVKLDTRYSHLPEELVTLILEKNLMYPITKDKDGNIWYHIVSNQRRVHKRIEEGNTKTAISRLEDGVFYYNNDSTTKLKDFESKLKDITFHPKLGSYADKKVRVIKLTKEIAQLMGLKIDKSLDEALLLIKNDKATSLVGEFTSLEGIVGREYALRDGVNKQTTEILSEYFLPEVNGIVPKTINAKVLSLADKLDTLLSITKVEKIPTGSNDPFEIRRTVYKILQLLVKAELDIDLSSFFIEREELLNFIQVRFEQMLLETGKEPWIAHNVTYSTSVNFSQKWQFANELSKAVKDENQRDQILEVIKRVNNILRKHREIIDQISMPTKSAIESIEKVTKPARNMTEAIEKATKPMRDIQEKINGSLSQIRLAPHTPLDKYESNLFNFISNKQTFSANDILELSELLTKFFEETLIMDKDEKIRDFRIGLLIKIRELLSRNYQI